MKSFLAIALVMASLTSMAHAAPQDAKLVCDVITNGNGASWETVKTIKKTIITSEKFNELEFKVASKYGDKFAVQVSLVLSSSALLSVSSDIPGTNASVFGQSRGDLNELDVNSNIVVTNTTFTLKKTPKNFITYSVSCTLK